MTVLDRRSSGDRWRVRPDGLDKVTGRLAYLTDRYEKDMLYGRVLRSEYPYAKVLSVRTERAEELSGVHAVLTSRDVPGLNRFGIAFPHQPVFCEDVVRYVGDAVAAVAADREDIAEHALSLIEVEYEPLEPIVDPAHALTEHAPLLHPDGNVLHRTAFSKGDVQMAFERCAHIVEETYWTPRQMHTYMETEGGLFVPEADGRLTVYSATQHGLKDRMQLSRILGIPEEEIRVVSSPIGGSFGGKDELNVQPYGALLARATGKPVKLHNSRKESVRAGLKRHPMKITMKTGMDENCLLVAHQVCIISDTGAYATLGAEILNFATEHAVGPYRMDHIEVAGTAVYTNNGVSGEFRGFGGNQAYFALEGQMDRLAHLAGIDAWAFRARNLRKESDPGPFGQQIAPTDGARQVWEALNRCPLRRDQLALARANEKTSKASPSEPWIRTGIGAAVVMHGAGLGYGIPDPAGGKLRLGDDGKIEAIFGYEEFGQGLIATMEQMLIEQFGFAPSDLRIVIGDTDRVPDSGSSTASRATSMMWMALQRLRPDFTKQLMETAAKVAGRPAEDFGIGPGGIVDREGKRVMTYAELAAKAVSPVQSETSFHYPVTTKKRVGAHFLYSFAAVAVKVEVNVLTGRVKVVDQNHVVAAGPVMNPQGYIGQIEGGSWMGLGFALMEDALMKDGRYVTQNLDSYFIPTISDIAANCSVEAIDDLPECDQYGPRGIGEIGSVGLAPAVAEAVFQAVGKRLVKLPIDPELLQERPFVKERAVGEHV